MKILLVVDSYWGGAGNVMQILAGELKRRGYEVTLLLLNGALVSPKHDLSGVNVIDYPLVQSEPARTPLGRVLKYRNAVARLIFENSPDVILSNMTEYNALCAMTAGKKIPLVLNECNNPFQEKTKPHWALLRRVFNRYAELMVVQCSLFAEFHRPMMKDRIRVIPNPIVEPAESYRLRDDNEIRLISLGRLHPQKNLPWMIEAVCRIHEKNPACSLTMYGAGEEEARLRALICEKNAESYIQLAGKTDTPHAVMAESDIYLMTSDFEGFPNALSEAMSVGLPTVTRLCHEGMRDLVTDGVNGYLIPPDDMDGYVERVLALAADPMLRKTVGDSARRVTETFSTTRIADLWEDAIREAIQINEKRRNKL